MHDKNITKQFNDWRQVVVAMCISLRHWKPMCVVCMMWLWKVNSNKWLFAEIVKQWISCPLPPPFFGSLMWHRFEVCACNSYTVTTWFTNCVVLCHIEIHDHTDDSHTVLAHITCRLHGAKWALVSLSFSVIQAYACCMTTNEVWHMILVALMANTTRIWISR